MCTLLLPLTLDIESGSIIVSDMSNKNKFQWIQVTHISGYVSIKLYFKMGQNSEMKRTLIKLLGKRSCWCVLEQGFPTFFVFLSSTFLILRVTEITIYPEKPIVNCLFQFDECHQLMRRCVFMTFHHLHNQNT